jgi:hypothetical protein
MKSAARTTPRVDSFRRKWTDNTSAHSKKASCVVAVTKPSARAFSREASRPHTTTVMPKALP